MNLTNRIVIWSFLFFVLTWRTLPFLIADIPAGWDTLGHYYLTNLMVEYLKEFKISGYDYHWLGGYPAFTLYAPLFYIIIAAIHLLSFGFISVNKAFQIVIFAQPFIFLIATFAVSKVFFNSRVAYYSLVSGLIVLFLGMDYSFFKIGLVGNLFIGVSPSIFALNLLLLLLAILGSMTKSSSWKLIIPGTLLLSAIILSHMITTVFAVWLILIFTCCYLKKCWLRVVTIVMLATLLTAFWWIPFLQHLPYSSSQAINLQSLSPLSVILPDVKITTLRAIFTYPLNPIEVDLPLFNHQFIKLQTRGIFLAFPLTGIIFGLTLLISCISLIQRKQLFLVLLFLFSLLFLPNNYLSEIFNIGIHYYRFVQYIVAIEVILVAFGLVIIQDYCYQKCKKFPNIFLLILLITITQTILFKLDWQSTNSLRSATSDNNPNFKFDITRYDSYPATQKVIDFFNQPIAGRIALETNMNGMTKDGSPHLLASLLPLITKAEIIPGLLVESSLSAVFINSTLGIGSNHMIWGQDNIYFSEIFQEQPPETIIARLKLYNVQFIVSNSKDYFKYLNKITKKNSELELVFQAGDYAIFEIKNVTDKIYTSQELPWFFYSDDLAHFRLFSEFWFSGSDNQDIKIIFDTKNKYLHRTSDLDPLLPNLSGLIIYADKYPKEEWEQKITALSKLTKKSIFVLTEAKKIFLPEGSKEQIFLINITKNNHKMIFDLIKKESEPNKNFAPITDFSIKKNQINFEAMGPSVINYSFAPKWQAKNSEDVFLVSPSQMMTIASGEIELEYK